MKLLIVKSAKGEDPDLHAAIATLTENVTDWKLLDTSKMDIRPCTGCNCCFLVTPGVCSIHDDYSQVLQTYLQYDHIVWIVDTALGFMDHKAKTLIDRMTPIVTVLTTVHDGKIRHIPRYDFHPRIAMLYRGNADREMLQLCLEQIARHMSCDYAGVFPIQNGKEAVQCLF